MAPAERHPDDITHKLLSALVGLVVLSAAGVIALIVVRPATFWQGVPRGSERIPLPCIRNTTMEMSSSSD